MGTSIPLFRSATSDCPTGARVNRISCHHHTTSNTSLFLCVLGLFGLLELWAHAEAMDCPPFPRDTHTHTKLKDYWQSYDHNGHLYTSTGHPRAWKTSGYCSWFSTSCHGRDYPPRTLTYMAEGPCIWALSVYMITLMWASQCSYRGLMEPHIDVFLAWLVVAWWFLCEHRNAHMGGLIEPKIAILLLFCIM